MEYIDHPLLTSDKQLLELLKRQDVIAPLVTVVVTVFNYERYVTDCLRSIAGQSYQNFECLVVDDCSSDQSVTMVKKFISDYQLNDKFLLLEHETNQGQMAGFKTGCDRARGEFVVYVDADDLLLPDFLVSHLSVHLYELPVAFTSSDQYQINELGEVIAGRHSDLQSRGRYRHVSPHYLFENSWLWATTSSMMFRRATLQLILPDVTEPFRVCADNYICHFGNLVGGSILIPERLGCYRRHGANSFSKNRIVGGQHPTGDMRTHPHHETIRKEMVAHLLNYSDRFITVLAGWWFLVVLARVAGFVDALRFVVGSTWPKRISLSSKYKLAFILRSFVNHVRWRLRRFAYFGPSVRSISKVGVLGKLLK